MGHEEEVGLNDVVVGEDDVAGGCEQPPQLLFPEEQPQLDWVRLFFVDGFFAYS